MSMLNSTTIEPTAVQQSGMPPVSVQADCNHAAWNDYVRRHPGGLFHRSTWENVWQCYRLPVHQLAAFRGDDVVGVLPLVEQKSVLFGHHLVSVPWFDAAGVLADDDVVAQELVAAAEKLRMELGSSTVLLRQKSEAGYSPYCRRDKVLMRLRLPESSEELWKSLKAKVRNQVRKAEKEGVVVHSGGRELLNDFFEVYAHNMRDLGSPSQSLRLFTSICDNFEESVRIWTVSFDQQVIGAGFTLANGSILEIPWASSLRRYNHLCVNHAMYWHILEQACESGYEWFHFGRSSVDSGTYKFKKQWGAEPLPLYWYVLGDDETAAAATRDPSESFGLAQTIWQKLPVGVTRQLGPKLVSKLA